MYLSGSTARRLACALSLAIVTLFGTASAFAQMELAVMQGTVKDEAGKPIPDVTLTLKDADRGQEIVLKSDKSGRFYRRGLQATEYSMTVEKEGYQSLADKLRLTAGTDRRFDFKLAKATPAGTVEFQEGVKAFNAGDFQAAAKSFEAAVERAPTIPDLRVNLALAYYRLERTADAVAQLEKAASLAPNDPRLQFQLGSAYVDMKDMPKAAAAFEAGLAKVADPKDPIAYEARVTLGAIQFAMGDADKAKATYEQALAQQPNGAAALLGLGKVLSQSDVDEAIRTFERVVSMHPGTPQATEAQAFITALKK
ncbi:MAG: tetratricopeptide repeat protein [Vicinamibacterales bacterium]